jgi:serine palmitoyltransferase
MSAMSELKEVPFIVALCTYWSWTVLFLIGHVRDALAKCFWERGKNSEKGYAPLRQDYEDFYTRRVYYRVVECFSRPVCGPPDRVIDVALRRGTDVTKLPKETGELRKCINLGSYNYLGFASQVRCFFLKLD